MSGLKNCARCGRLFAGEGRTVCRKCQVAEDDDYSIVRKYVRDYPGASVFEVAEATGVEEEKILHFLRDGRLQSQGLASMLECERCGRSINEGKYCSACVKELQNEIGHILPSKNNMDKDIPKSSKDRMYTKENKNR
ncbi:MAG: MerR family transcriptional regulator [Syntrophomonadaceae bacterium]|nr:MerR family transcriptional regulator [Syntrophomonadaceae bacterium]